MFIGMNTKTNPGKLLEVVIIIMVMIKLILATVMHIKMLFTSLVINTKWFMPRKGHHYLVKNMSLNNYLCR